MSIEDITEAVVEFEEYWDGGLGGYIETGSEGETLHIQIVDTGLRLSLETDKTHDEDGRKISELSHQERFLSWEELKALVANR